MSDSNSYNKRQSPSEGYKRIIESDRRGRKRMTKISLARANDANRERSNRRRGHTHDFWPVLGGYQCACGADRNECERCSGVCENKDALLCIECAIADYEREELEFGEP
jgi:hypothetical protein